MDKVPEAKLRRLRRSLVQSRLDGILKAICPRCAVAEPSAFERLVVYTRNRALEIVDAVAMAKVLSRTMTGGLDQSVFESHLVQIASASSYQLLKRRLRAGTTIQDVGLGKDGNLYLRGENNPSGWVMLNLDLEALDEAVGRAESKHRQNRAGLNALFAKRLYAKQNQ